MNEKLKNRLSKFVDGKKDSHKLKTADRYDPQYDFGLTAEQVAERREDKLFNIKSKRETKPYWKIVFDNLFNFCNTTCILLVILLCVIGAADYTVSTSIIFVNIIIGIYQEVKAKKAVTKLSVVQKQACSVMRDGVLQEVPAEEIVLDDIVIVNAGQQVPVDAVILYGGSEVDESILTGESVPIKKKVSDKLLAGSSIIAGEAYCRADRVGKDCYIEGIVRIAKRINRPKSNIFDTLNKIIKGMSIILVFLAVLLLVSERVAVHGAWKQTMISVSSSILSMLPIGIFMLTSAALAVSVLKLSRSNALPQDIYSVEMLATVDTLLLDKTGTITDGNLEVIDVQYLSENKSGIDSIIMTINTVTHDNKNTANAMKKYFCDSPILECTEVVSFSSARKWSAVTISGKSYFLGAPEMLVSLTHDLQSFCDNNAKEGKRSLLLVEFDGAIDDFDIRKTTPLAGIALEDTLRPNVEQTLEWFYTNDVDIKIISGDNPITVSNIASKCNVQNCDKYVNCATLTDIELKEKVKETAIFGRVSPEQKCLIVHQLQAQGKVVGMIGDGVNDVQALKEADCSISFGQANEVARNISRIVLLDNNFASLPNIVKEGRKVINNIETVSSMYLMKNFFVMFMTLMFAIITITTQKITYPFDTKKMLLIEFFVIGAPSFLYAVQPNKGRIKGDFMRNVLVSSVAAGCSMILATCFVYIMLGYIDFSAVPANMLSNYTASMLTLAMTMSGFVALIIISWPVNIFRLLVLIGSFVLTWTAVYVDTLYLKGTFLGMEIISPKHFSILAIAAGIALVCNLILRFGLRKLDERYGASVIGMFDSCANGIKNCFKKKQK